MGKMKEFEIKAKEVKDRVVRFAKANKKELISAAVGGIVNVATNAYFVGKDSKGIELRSSKNADKIDYTIDRLGENSDDMRLVLRAYEADIFTLADAENKNSDAAFNRINRIENGVSMIAGLGAAGLTHNILDRIWPDETEYVEETEE